jgi:GAF domain-containing protein
MPSSKQPTEYGQQLVALGQILQTLREADRLESVLEAILKHLQSAGEYNLIWIGWYDRDRQALEGIGGIAPKSETRILKQQLNLSPGELMEQVLIQQRPLAVADITAEAKGGEWRRIAKSCGVQGTAIYPLRYKGSCLGVILLGSPHWGMSPSTEEKAKFLILFGELAAALTKMEQEKQRQSAKKPQEVLLALLSPLRGVIHLEPYLETIVEETHQFLSPSGTYLYWLDAQKHQFRRRASNRDRAIRARLDEGGANPTELTVQSVLGFYQALADNRVVSVGESYTTVQSDTPSPLMRQLQARSLLAAPILFKNELLGFLAVEGKEARIWQEDEKHYIRCAAQLIAIATPLNQMEETVRQVKADQKLTAGIASAIYSDKDWKNTLTQSVDRLNSRLGVQRCIVLLYNRDLGHFEVTYQTAPHTKRPLESPLPVLSDLDIQLLQTSLDPIAIEHWTERQTDRANPYDREFDIRFSAWHDAFTHAGVRSLMVCNTSLGCFPDGLLVVASDTPHSWEVAEQEMLKVVSQQIGLVLHQWQLQRTVDLQQQLIETIQWGLTNLHNVEEVSRLEHLTLEQIAQVLRVPLVALITWESGSSHGHLTHTISTTPGLAPNPNCEIALDSDSLIQQALSIPGVAGPFKSEDLSADLQKWLKNAQTKQVMATALRTAPEHQVTGVLIFADRTIRTWTKQDLERLELLLAQLAQSRRSILLAQKLQSHRESLEALNWYKHRRIEEFYRNGGSIIKKLHHDTAAARLPLSQEQSLRQLSNAIGTLGPLLKTEQWQLDIALETVPVAGILKRAIDRVEPLRKQRQVWLKVNREGHFNIRVDRPKLELIFYELLMLACQRSPQEKQVDIWYRPLEVDGAIVQPAFLEMLIVDEGTVDPRLLADYERGRSADLLAPSFVDRPPGVYLLIYQQIMGQMGGEFAFYPTEDGRTVSRLLVPLVSID